MRTVLLFVLLTACGPGFDIDARDGGRDLDAGDLDAVGLDAGDLDAGPEPDASSGDSGSATQSVLSQVEDCADIFETRGEYFDFETQLGPLIFDGAAEIVDGSLRFWPDADNPIQGGSNSFFSRQDFRSLGTCIDALTPASGTGRQLIFAGKALGEGTSCLIDMGDGLFSMRDVFTGAVITQVSVPWASEQLELRMFSYNEDSTSICEVMRLDTREVFRLESDEGSPTDAIHVEMFIYGDGEAAQALVREVSTGAPHDRFRRLSDEG